MKIAKLLFIAVAGCTSALAQDLPEGLPLIPFHLTARPWRALSVARQDYLEVIEGLCRFTEKLRLWQERLRTPRGQVVRGGLNNWRTYAMRGEWNRSALGLAKRPEAVAFIEDAWLHATAVANAGGMQMLAALRGATAKVYDHYWTALGVERFGRVNWDTRLGPADGERDPAHAGCYGKSEWHPDCPGPIHEPKKEGDELVYRQASQLYSRPKIG